MKNKLGIFGGTFNPIHLGHLIVASQTKEILNLDKIIYIPSNIPPHKSHEEIINAEHRLEMLKLALTGNKNFTFSAVEIERQGISYTIDTLKILKKLYPKSQLFFMIGADNLKEIKHWKDPEGIIKLANLAVLARPGYKKYIKNYKKYFSFLSKKELIKKINIISINEIDISSSLIQKRLTKNKPIDYLVPDNVKEYIIKHKLYRK